MNRIAVYGTLKKGRGNSFYLRDAKHVGNGVTAEKYRLCITSLPYLLDEESNSGFNVKVEVYDINDTTFSAVDMLEGHPRFYRRRKTNIVLNNGNQTEAWVYFVGEGYDNCVYYEEY